MPQFLELQLKFYSINSSQMQLNSPKSPKHNQISQIPSKHTLSIKKKRYPEIIIYFDPEILRLTFPKPTESLQLTHPLPLLPLPPRRIRNITPRRSNRSNRE